MHRDEAQSCVRCVLQAWTISTSTDIDEVLARVQDKRRQARVKDSMTHVANAVHAAGPVGMRYIDLASTLTMNLEVRCSLTQHTQTSIPMLPLQPFAQSMVRAGLLHKTEVTFTPRKGNVVLLHIPADVPAFFRGRDKLYLKVPAETPAAGHLTWKMLQSGEWLQKGALLACKSHTPTSSAADATQREAEARAAEGIAYACICTT